ncbi:Uncharacterised protein [Vibrio cholerae]|nr:Uncharacterised protein [Vibrio cholerae]
MAGWVSGTGTSGSSPARHSMLMPGIMLSISITPSMAAAMILNQVVSAKEALISSHQ